MNTTKKILQVKAIFRGIGKEITQGELANMLGVSYWDVPWIVEQVDGIRCICAYGENVYVKGFNI